MNEQEKVELYQEIERLNNIIFNQNKRNSHQRIANDNLQNKNKKLNNIIKRVKNEVSGAYTDLSNNFNVNYMHEALKKDLLEILKGGDE